MDAFGEQNVSPRHIKQATIDAVKPIRDHVGYIQLIGTSKYGLIPQDIFVWGYIGLSEIIADP